MVGAGSGDPGLFTLRGLELLKQADLVIGHRLVARELLRHAKKSAGVAWAETVQDLYARAAAGAREGHSVVCLVGDLALLESTQALAAGVLDGATVEVVPGVSVTEAAPSFAGIPLLEAGRLSGYAVVSIPPGGGAGSGAEDWRRLGELPGTLVVRLAAAQIGATANHLASLGRPVGTPAAIIIEGGTGGQRVIQGTLATVGSSATAFRGGLPVLLVVGEAVGLRATPSWFERRPLFGQRIVVTRAREQAAQLAAPLLAKGAQVLEIPCIKFGPPAERGPIIDALAGLNSYDWIVFTSATGVTRFFEMFFQGFQDMRDIGGVKIAAVGPATAARLKELHLQVDAMPKEYVASQITAAMSELESLENRAILLLRAEVANPELPNKLNELGAIVDDVACYQTLPETEDPDGAAGKFLAAGAEWITFTSGSTAANFHARFNLPQILRQFPGLRLASIGPETTKVIASLGLEPAVEARPHTMDGLVEALEKAVLLPAGQGAGIS